MFVLTHLPPAGPPPDVTFVGHLPSAVEQSKQAAGERYVNVLGANVAEQCIEVEAGLLDEILMFVAPLLGDGVRMFDHPGGADVRLEPLAGGAEHWYGVVD